MASSYNARVTSRIPATLAAHPDWTTEDARRYLRGHGAPGEGITPEHGGAGRRRPEPGAPAAHRRVQAGPGRTVDTTYRDREVHRDVNRAAASGRASGDMPRVQIATHTQREGWQIVGQTHKGYSAEELERRIARHGGDVRAAVAELIQDSATGRGSDFDIDGYDNADHYAREVDDWQVVVNE